MKGLRRCLFSLVWLLSVVSFWYCNDYVSLIIERQQVSFTSYESKEFPAWTCFQRAYSNYINFDGLDLSWNVVWDDLESMSDKTAWTYQYVCLLQSGLVHYKYSNTNVPFYYYDFSFLVWDSSSCPDTWEILSWYILESEIDNLYCENNWLCSLINSWDVIGSWNWSSLYINDIQHESAPLINLTIPEEFEWDYTNENDEFNLWISWYNVDTEYIDWIIRNQTTLPNKTDFNNTISWLIPLFVPWLVIIASLYFIFRFIKKIF